jgi:hypothetical protein
LPAATFGIAASLSTTARIRSSISGAGIPNAQGLTTAGRRWIVLDWVCLSDLGSRRSSYRRHLDNREDP